MSISNVTNLSDLNLTETNVTDECLAKICGSCSKLTSVSLTNTKISSAAALALLDDLMVLNVNRCPMNDNGISPLTRLTSLVRLNIVRYDLRLAVCYSSAFLRPNLQLFNFTHTFSSSHFSSASLFSLLLVFVFSFSLVLRLLCSLLSSLFSSLAHFLLESLKCYWCWVRRRQVHAIAETTLSVSQKNGEVINTICSAYDF
jgi:hypothetical protein